MMKRVKVTVTVQLYDGSPDQGGKLIAQSNQSTIHKTDGTFGPAGVSILADECSIVSSIVAINRLKGIT